MKKLRPEEKTELETRLKNTKDVSEWRRVFCILEYYDKERSTDEIAELLRISPFTVEKYLNDYIYKNKTKNGLSGGSEPKLTPRQTEELIEHLTKITYLKVEAIRKEVKRRFGVEYSRSGMNQWLKEHGFEYKKPQKIPGKMDPEKQEAFIREYEKIKASLKQGDEIYFADAVHPEHQSQAVRGWIRKGEKKTLQTTGKQLRVHFAGAVNLKGMKVIMQEYATIDTEAMLDFVRKLEGKAKRGTIHLILDNGRAHKNKKMEEYLKTSRIKVHYLPPYSPNLNPIERLWKIMRATKMYNRYYKTAGEFFEEIRGFFRKEIPKMKEILELRINDKFQVIKPNPVCLA